jgi:hypothetical protein
MKSLLIFFISLSFSQDELWKDQGTSFLHQIQEIRFQLEAKMEELPPIVDRIAIHQLKVSNSDFRPGISRYVRSQIEEVFQVIGRKAVISAPELKTVRIVSTDTTFKMSNAIPDAEALWEVGRKFRIDGFVQGSLVKTEQQDLILSLKLIQQGTAEILWSGTFIAGPNKPKFDKRLEFSTALGFSLWDITKYQGTTTDTTEGLSFYRYFVEARVGEAVTHAQKVFLSLVGGLGIYLPVAKPDMEEIFDEVASRLEASAGMDMLIVLWPKPGKGYYFGLNFGGRAIFPHKFMQVQVGLSNRMTEHFGIEIGGSYYPFHNIMQSSSFSLSEYQIEMQRNSYEARLFYYF